MMTTDRDAILTAAEMKDLAIALGTIMDNFTSGGPGSGHDFALRAAMCLAVIGCYPELQKRNAMTKDLYRMLPSSALSTTRSRFNRVMKMLNERGYIVIQQSTTDPRGQEYVITEEGMAKLKAIQPPRL